MPPQEKTQLIQVANSRYGSALYESPSSSSFPVDDVNDDGDGGASRGDYKTSGRYPPSRSLLMVALLSAVFGAIVTHVAESLWASADDDGGDVDGATGVNTSEAVTKDPKMVAAKAKAEKSVKTRGHSSNNAAAAQDFDQENDSFGYYTRNIENKTGPYKLVELQSGDDFFSYYKFYEGEDSIGSAGYNTYLGRDDAKQLGLFNVTSKNGHEYVYMRSAENKTEDPEVPNMRSSVRLEGINKYDRGLFILDVDHVPAGCGVWPAFWLADEKVWPFRGEIDIVEGINNQDVAKTALHTSESCTMYGHVPPYEKTGEWDIADRIPNKLSGGWDNVSTVEADNCWIMAPHQWPNQGCVAVSTQKDSLGQGLNEQGGGVFVLEWDPDNGYIKSWVFPGKASIPRNLQDVLDTTSPSIDPSHRVMPTPREWKNERVLPYAYFAIGEGSGCSADHFQNMRVIFNLAFCGTVAGNRFVLDCPDVAEPFLVHKSDGKTVDPVATCNAYMDSNPEALEEAYWKIRGVYVYQRD